MATTVYEREISDAEPALPPPPAPAAPAPEPAPLVAPALEPAVVAPAPRIEQEVNFHFCYKSSLAFRFRQLGFSSTFLLFRLPICSLSTCFLVYPILLLAIFGLGVVCGLCSALVAFRLLCFSCLVFYFLSPFYGLVGCGANPLCFVFCFVSVIVLLVRYFTTLAHMGRVLLFGVAFLHILSFSFLLEPFVCLPLSSGNIYFICLL